MAALANVVTQLGTLMAATPIATKILGGILGWFIFDYVLTNYGTSTAPPLQSLHPDAVSWIPLKPNQKVAVLILEDKPERVCPTKNAVHMSSYVFMMLAIGVILWLLRKPDQAPAAAGDDDDRSEDQVLNPNPPTPESETDAVQPRPPEDPAPPDPGSRTDASTQTSSLSNAENNGNVAHAEAMKKAQEAVADLESQVAALRQQGRNDAKINGDLKRELAAAKAKSEDLEVKWMESRSHADDQMDISTQLQSRVTELEAKLTQSEQSRSDLNDRVTATTLQFEEEKQALKQVEAELAGTREQVDTLTKELDSSRTQVDTISQELDSSRTQVDTLTQELVSSRTQVDTLSQELNSSREQVDKILALEVVVGTLTKKLADYRDQVNNTLALDSAQEESVATEVQMLDKEASESDAELQPINTPTSTPPQHPVAQEEPVAEEAQDFNTEAIECNVEASVVDTQAQVPTKVELSPRTQPAESVPKVLPPHLRPRPAKPTETAGLSPTPISTSGMGVTDAVPHAVPSGMGRMGGSTIANPPSVPSSFPVKWHCDTCHCAFLEETVPKSAHENVCKNWSDKSYSRLGSAVGYPPDWKHAVHPYPTEKIAFWVHQMSRPPVSPSTAGPSNPLKPTAEVFTPAGVDNWSNHESHNACDDAQANARARQEYERQARDTFRLELRETDKPEQGKAQLIPALIKPAASVSQTIAPTSSSPAMQKNAPPTKGMGGSKWATNSSQATPPQVTNQPSTLSCLVCGGNFKGWSALAIHTPKCQAWKAKAAPRQYTSFVNGKPTISYPPGWIFSHTDNDPEPEWLSIARQKVHPIRDARGNKMQAKRNAELIVLAEEIDRDTEEMKKQEKEAEEAKKAQEATKAQPAMQMAVADVKKEEAKPITADQEKQACLDRMAAREKEARERVQKKKDKNGGLLPKKAEKSPVKKSQKSREVPSNGKKPNAKK